jgi:hypothetical protein
MGEQLQRPCFLTAAGRSHPWMDALASRLQYLLVPPITSQDSSLHSCVASTVTSSSDMVWYMYGMVWYGVVHVWYGMVWYGMVWGGIIGMDMDMAVAVPLRSAPGLACWAGLAGGKFHVRQTPEGAFHCLRNERHVSPPPPLRKPQTSCSGAFVRPIL